MYDNWDKQWRQSGRCVGMYTYRICILVCMCVYIQGVHVNTSAHWAAHSHAHVVYVHTHDILPSGWRKVSLCFGLCAPIVLYCAVCCNTLQCVAVRCSFQTVFVYVPIGLYEWAAQWTPHWAVWMGSPMDTTLGWPEISMCAFVGIQGSWFRYFLLLFRSLCIQRLGFSLCTGVQV